MMLGQCLIWPYKIGVDRFLIQRAFHEVRAPAHFCAFVFSQREAHKDLK